MLGASNLSRAFPIAVSMSQQVFETPVDFLVAKGHGRSYGNVSSCLGKKIPGIFSCGIWRAIEQEKSVPITAFVTDIGNDLAYEVPVETIVAWVESCLDRLLAHRARVVLSDLPLVVFRQLSTTRYRCFRALFFPQCRLPWSEMLRRAQQLSERLQEVAKSLEIPLFVGRREWYGLDPIHPRKGCYSEMWTELLAIVTEIPSDRTWPRCSFASAWYLRSLQCENWSTFSFSRRASQPNGRLRDGSTISLY